MDICGDNRFEIIAKAKSDFLEATNIALSKEAMKVLDNFLFRCWQVGWLDRYDTADTPQTDCDDRYALRTDSGEVVAYACPLGCEQTDCPWK